VNFLLSPRKLFPKVGKLIEAGKFRAAFKGVLEVAEHGNRYVNKKEPWKKIKDDIKRNEVEVDLAVLVHLIRVLALLVNPFLPRTSEKIYTFLGLSIQDESWKYPKPNAVQEIVQVLPLFHKIEEAEIEEQLTKLKQHVGNASGLE